MTQQIEASIDIEAPIETVWATVHDPPAIAEGIDGVYEVWWEDDAPVGRGSVYVERARPGVKEGLYRWELILEPVAYDHTRYTQRMRFQALPAFRPLGCVVERTVMERQMRRDFERMILPNDKRIAERGADTAPS